MSFLVLAASICGVGQCMCVRVYLSTSHTHCTSTHTRVLTYVHEHLNKCIVHCL